MKKLFFYIWIYILLNIILYFVFNSILNYNFWFIEINLAILFLCILYWLLSEILLLLEILYIPILIGKFFFKIYKKIKSSFKN